MKNNKQKTKKDPMRRIPQEILDKLAALNWPLPNATSEQQVVLALQGFLANPTMPTFTPPKKPAISS